MHSWNVLNPAQKALGSWLKPGVNKRSHPQLLPGDPLAPGNWATACDIIGTSKAMSDRRALHLLPVVSRANLFAD